MRQLCKFPDCKSKTSEGSSFCREHKQQSLLRQLLRLTNRKGKLYEKLLSSTFFLT